jgi:hypothetical protein
MGGVSMGGQIANIKKSLAKVDFQMATWTPQNRSNRKNPKKLWAYCPKVSSHQVSLK